MKNGGISLVKQLTIFFNHLSDDGEIPREWKTGIIIPIFKKGQKNDPKNYRGITLLIITQQTLHRIENCVHKRGIWPVGKLGNSKNRIEKGLQNKWSMTSMDPTRTQKLLTKIILQKRYTYFKVNKE